MSGRAADLKRTQELFWSLIAAPEGVRPAVAGLARGGRTGDDALEEVFVGDERLPAVDRVDIYANMYFYRLLDSLREDYPRVAAAIGGARFHNLVTDYLLRHPSSHPSLRHLGRSLPAFLGGHPIGRAYPYLADLAALEWARIEAFDAPDAEPVTRDDLARLPGERAGEARPVLIPAFRLLRFDHDVVRLWRDLKDPGTSDSDGAARGTEGNAALEGADHDRPARGPRRVKRRRVAASIWRSGFIVYHKPVTEDEAHCLELAAQGESLGRICQVLAAGRSPARATEKAGRILQGWIDDGLIMRLNLPEI